jgi:hypothetical protein
MQASIESQQLNIDTLGILAGGGQLPAQLVHACETSGITPFIIGFKGHTDPELVRNRFHLWTRLGRAGQVINCLKSRDIRHLVFAGGIRRPGLSELRPDWRAARFFMRAGMRSLGDDSLLKAVRRELESEGFSIHGVQEFLGDILAKDGAMGNHAADDRQWGDIRAGLRIARALGAVDVGQAVVMQDGLCLGVEAIEGTDALIQRCGELKRGGRYDPVLIKVSKPGQDHDMDLPTIGPETVENAYKGGYAGIVIEAGHALVLDTGNLVNLADRYKMFVMGVPVEQARDVYG